MAQATPLEKGAGSRTQAAGQTEERCQRDMPAVGGKGGGCRTTWQEGFALAPSPRGDGWTRGRRADERKSDGDARVRRRSSTAPASPPGRHPLVSLRMHAMRRGNWDGIVSSWDMRLGLGGILPRGRAPLDRSLDECTVRKESVGAALPATARRLMVGSHARADSSVSHFRSTDCVLKKTVESASWPLSEGQVG